MIGDSKHSTVPWTRMPCITMEGFLILSDEKAVAVIPALDGREPDETEANANLMFAAPELLEALKGFIAVAEESAGVAGYHLNGDLAPWGEFEHVAEAEAAIAKAEGSDHG